MAIDTKNIQMSNKYVKHLIKATFTQYNDSAHKSSNTLLKFNQQNNNCPVLKNLIPFIILMRYRDKIYHAKYQLQLLYLDGIILMKMLSHMLKDTLSKNPFSISSAPKLFQFI